MKALGILLLALVVGFVGYNYAYPSLATSFDLKKHVEAVIEPAKPTVVEVKPKPKPAEETKPKTDEAPMAPKPEPMPEAPMVAVTGGMGEAIKVEPKEGEFVPPTFPAIEEVVKGWLEIPKGAFTPPRPVKLLVETEFKMSVGSTKMKPGGMVAAVGQEGPMIVIAPTETSAARGRVGIDDTNLKEVLNTAYEKWKVLMTERAKRQFEFKKNAGTRAVAGGSTATAAPNNTKPTRDADGTYPLLITSMKTGKVTEITPQNIKKWGDVVLEKIDGKDYWTVIVNYTTKTMFGDFDVEAQARIFNGAVEKWVYTGSGEVVP
jgi:hypothetical protein